jgi:multidrug efflux pump subunit AcrB
MTYRYDPQALMDMKVTFRDMLTGQIRQVPISAMATAERSSTFSAIKRKDLDRVVTISSNVISADTTATRWCSRSRTRWPAASPWARNST